MILFNYHIRRATTAMNAGRTKSSDPTFQRVTSPGMLADRSVSEADTNSSGTGFERLAHDHDV